MKQKKLILNKQKEYFFFRNKQKMNKVKLK